MNPGRWFIEFLKKFLRQWFIHGRLECWRSQERNTVGLWSRIQMNPGQGCLIILDGYVNASWTVIRMDLLNSWRVFRILMHLILRFWHILDDDWIQPWMEIFINHGKWFRWNSYEDFDEIWKEILKNPKRKFLWILDGYSVESWMEIVINLKLEIWWKLNRFQSG